MDKKENICRLCLKFEDNAFYPLDDTSREKLEVVVPELNFKVPSTFEICCSCTESLDCAYDFKISVSENENTIHSKIADLKDDKKPNLADIISEQGEAKANGTVGSESKGVCRTCLKTCSAEDNPTNVSNEEPESLINNILRVCLADMDIEMTANPILCETCVTTLREIYSFICKSLSIEKKIKEQIESNSTDKDHLDNVLTVIKEELGKSNSDFFSEFEIQDEDGPDNVDGLTFVDENDKKKKRPLEQGTDGGDEPPVKKEKMAPKTKKETPDSDGIPYFKFCNDLLFSPILNESALEDWLSKVEEIKQKLEWSDGQAMNKVLTLLKGMPALHNWFSNISYIMNWEDWKRKLIDAFPAKDDFYLLIKRVAHRKKKPLETYTNYCTSKLMLLEPLNFNVEQQISCLIGGVSDILVSTGARIARHKSTDELLVYFKSCDDKGPTPEELIIKDKINDLNGKSANNKQTRSKKLCYICRQDSHSAGRCPFNKANQDKKNTQNTNGEKSSTKPKPTQQKCGYCGKKGHSQAACWQAKLDKQNKTGGNQRPAQQKPNPIKRAIDRQRCNYCGKWGHKQRDCLQEKHDRKINNMSSYSPPGQLERNAMCYKCYKVGHSTQACPELLMNKRFGGGFNNYY